MFIPLDFYNRITGRGRGIWILNKDTPRSKVSLFYLIVNDYSSYFVSIFTQLFVPGLVNNHTRNDYVRRFILVPDFFYK